MMMQKIVFILLLSFTSVFIFAQNENMAPESNTVEETKAQKKTAFQNKREEFKSNSRKNTTPSQQDELDEIDADLKSLDSESYEYNLVHYINGNYDLARSENLFKAYALRPEEKEVQLEMFGYYLLKGDKTNQTKFASILKSNYSTLTLDYYSTLINQDKNVVILTSGQEDSYPAYILQLLENKGKNVFVVNLDFLQNDVYRKEICQIVSINPIKFVGNEKNFVSALVNNPKRPTYVSTTVHQNYCGHLSSQLYLQGLYYSKDASDQYQNLQSFWENCKKTDLSHLKFKNKSDKQLYSNYLPPLLLLYKLNKKNGVNDTVLKETIRALGTNLGKEKAVIAILNQYDTE